jgi:hypothetical protein
VRSFRYGDADSLHGSSSAGMPVSDRLDRGEQMDKTFFDLIKRQQESLDSAKGISMVPAISESLQKTLSAGSVASLLSSENVKLASSFIAMAATDRLAVSNFANIANPIVPSFIAEAAKLKSFLATDILALQASTHAKALSEFANDHHFNLAIKNLGSVATGSLIGDAIKRLNPVFSKSFLASQLNALGQFKDLAKATRSGDVFGEEISQTLRASFGDWREQIVLPSSPQSVDCRRKLTHLAR